MLALGRNAHQSDRATPLPALLAVTALASFATGVVWNGLPFIVKHEYGYAESQTLILHMLIGIVYVIAALGAGHAVRRFEHSVTPARLLAVLLLVQAGLCAVPLLLTPDNDVLGVNIWVVACGINLVSALVWPVIESFLSAGRHGRAMRNAIGWWNVTWTAAVTAALIAMAPLVDAGSARLAIVGLGALNVLAVVAMLWFPSRPAAHDEASSQREVAREYPYLLRSARVLLPMSYLLIAALSPLMPYQLADLEVQPRWETPITAVWMGSRVIAVAIMWRIGFWHGRWGTLLIGGIVLAGGFALIIQATSVPVMMAGLACFGAAQGVVYYAALYYAMAVGRAQVDAGGMHEALIGMGYIAGPAMTLLAISMHEHFEFGLSQEWLITAMIWGCVAISVIPAVMPYVRARRQRQSQSSADVSH